MEQKKTLIILSPGFAENEGDTTCLPPQQVFIKALNKNYPSVQIIILAFQYPFFKKQYKWFGNSIISFNGNDKRRFSRFLLWLTVYRILRKLKKQNDVIGLLSFWCTECALIAQKFSKKHGLKHLIWILGQDAKANNKYVKWINPLPGELIALSDFITDIFLKNHQVRPAYIIPVGIDTGMFKQIHPSRTNDIMGAGSLIPLKQYNIFVEVVAEVKKNNHAIKAVLCGTGSEEQKLKEMARQYSLEKNILLTGKKEHIEVLEFMQQSKIFLHPSSYEGFGSVCLEALYAGMHVISFVKPMKASIQNWHIVNTKEEMLRKTLELLNAVNTQYEPVLPYSVDDNATAMMQLFNYSK